MTEFRKVEPHRLVRSALTAYRRRVLITAAVLLPILGFMTLVFWGTELAMFAFVFVFAVLRLGWMWAKPPASVRRRETPNA